MIVINMCTIALILLIFSILFIIFTRLQKPLKIRQLSSHVPSATNNFWNEIQFSLTLGMKKPKGKN